jgi:hypothetical protein
MYIITSMNKKQICNDCDEKAINRCDICKDPICDFHTYNTYNGIENKVKDGSYCNECYNAL